MRRLSNCNVGTGMSNASRTVGSAGVGSFVLQSHGADKEDSIVGLLDKTSLSSGGEVITAALT